jgi:hypothetical protein
MGRLMVDGETNGGWEVNGGWGGYWWMGRLMVDGEVNGGCGSCTDFQSGYLHVKKFYQSKTWK